MKVKNLGILLLAVWLVLFGLSGFVNLGDLSKLLSVLAIAAGVLMLAAR